MHSNIRSSIPFNCLLQGSLDSGEHCPLTHQPILTRLILETMPLSDRQTSQRASVPRRCLDGRNSQPGFAQRRAHVEEKPRLHLRSDSLPSPRYRVVGQFPNTAFIKQ